MIIICIVYLTIYTIYISFLAISNFLLRDPKEQRVSKLHRFAVIIPAHNEELLIKRLIESFKIQNYPSDKYQLYVIADNCTDRTAQVATESGSNVFVRENANEKGKGYAINHAIQNIDGSTYDAILIVDADSTVNKECLKQLNILIDHGSKNIQLYNAVGNPYKTSLTTLMNVSRTIANEIMGPAKKKLGLSFHLMGNGMCFTSDIIERYGWDSFSVGEDWEFFSKLIQDDYVIDFAKYSKVYHQESQSLKQATPQRLRWSSGRFSILWKLIYSLARKRQKSVTFKKLDALTALIFPNPSLSINLMLLCLIFTVMFTEKALLTFLAFWILGLILMNATIFLIGCFYTSRPLKSLQSFLFAPLFLGWKLTIDLVSLFGAGRNKWTRTNRIKD